MFWSREKKNKDDEEKENYTIEYMSPSGTTTTTEPNWADWLSTEVDVFGYSLSYGMILFGTLMVVSLVGLVMYLNQPLEPEMMVPEMMAPEMMAPEMMAPEMMAPAMMAPPMVSPFVVPAPPRRSAKKKSAKKKSAKKKSGKRRY